MHSRCNCSVLSLWEYLYLRSTISTDCKHACWFRARRSSPLFIVLESSFLSYSKALLFTKARWAINPLFFVTGASALSRVGHHLDALRIKNTPVQLVSDFCGSKRVQFPGFPILFVSRFLLLCQKAGDAMVALKQKWRYHSCFEARSKQQKKIMICIMYSRIALIIHLISQSVSQSVSQLVNIF